MQGSDDRICNEDGAPGGPLRDCAAPAACPAGSFLRPVIRTGAQLAMDRAASTDKTHIVYKDLYHDLLNECKEDRERGRLAVASRRLPATLVALLHA